MDQVEPGCIVEFLDLSGIEDQERNWILSSLHSWNPHIQLPWVEDASQPQGYEPLHISNAKQQKCNYGAPQANVVVTTNINVNDQAYSPSPYKQQGPPITVYAQQPLMGYTQSPPEAAPNLHATFVVNSNINYKISNEASNTYINTKLEITQGFTNQPQHLNGGSLNNGSIPQSLVAEGNPRVTPAYLAMPEAPVMLDDNTDVQEGVRVQVEHNGDGCAHVDEYPVETEVQDCAVPAAKSWASLFNKNKASSPAVDSMGQESGLNKPLALVPPFVANLKRVKVGATNVTKLLLKEPFKSNADDPNLHRMGEYLSSHGVDNRIISLQPRGLINRSNYCYINSILQAILACPPVYNLLSGLEENMSPSTEKKKITPTIDSMTRFIREFHHLPAGMRVGRRLDKNQKKDHSVLINCEAPFEPFWLHKLLSGIRSDTFVVEGRQEDAEEFLGCLLNGLNDEMLELMKLVGGQQTCDPEPLLERNSIQDEDKEWQVMGPKNKGAITRRTEFSRTPISDVFGGLLRSRLHRTGDQSTDNIQPFFTLQLNIEKTSTVKEALEVLVCKNQLEGVTSSKTNEEVEAWQQVMLEELPIVLVLHLKCFDYKLDGCSKIIKALEFPIDLKIDTKLLSKTNYNPKERQYKLFAVVYHEGKEATKGHYVTDAYHVGYASWLRYDDASVKTVPEEHVLKPHGTRVPYLLFYRRSDSLSKK